MTRAILPALVVLLALPVTGCAQIEGDFGRPKPSLVRDEALPLVGGLVAKLRGEPVSIFVMTDDERLLRDHAYAFLAPPDGFRAINVPTAELTAARILPNLPAVPLPKTYALSLMTPHYRSTTARWQRLIDDIRSDSQRIAPFARVAARVIEMDRVRRESAKLVADLSEFERGQAMERMAENAKLIGDVRQALADRFETYRYAMEHLLVAHPAPAAVEAERALADLHRSASNPVLALAGPPVASAEHVGGPPRYYPGNDGAVVSK